ncbi:MAG: AAA family ATPase [Desulfobacca sp.]|nr:AAA family ATPase [Desulfobacca sp.]
MIKRVYAKNYRSLAEVEVSLDRLTILVGPNGSGKSNFVDVLRFISDALKRGMEYALDEREGIETLRRQDPLRPYDIEIESEIEDKNIKGKYRVHLKPPKAQEIDTLVNYEIKRESCDFELETESLNFEVANGKWVEKPKWVKIEPTSTDLILPLLTTKPFNEIVDYFKGMTFYNIYPNIMRIPTKVGSEYPLESDGRNIASVLRSMQRKKNIRLGDIKEALGVVVSGLTDVKIVKVGGFLRLKFKHEYKNKKAQEFEAYQESDGTLRVLGILVALFQDPPPELLVIEEPELTVHPGVLAVLADLIREASLKRSQVIVTTHSPDLISKFSAKDLRVVAWNYKDGTTISPVDENQIELINEKLFSSGDLLRIEGLRAQH